jgi:hypothetical protein
MVKIAEKYSASPQCIYNKCGDKEAPVVNISVLLSERTSSSMSSYKPSSRLVAGGSLSPHEFDRVDIAALVQTHI